jgi:hypothetical protein
MERGSCEYGNEPFRSVEGGNFLVGWETVTFRRMTLFREVSQLVGAIPVKLKFIFLYNI